MTTLHTGFEVAALATVHGPDDPDGFYMVTVGAVAGGGGHVVVGGGVYNTLPVMCNTMEV